MNITSVFYEERISLKKEKLLIAIFIVKDSVCWFDKSLQVIVWKNKEQWKEKLEKVLCPANKLSFISIDTND